MAPLQFQNSYSNLMRRLSYRMNHRPKFKNKNVPFRVTEITITLCRVIRKLIDRKVIRDHVKDSLVTLWHKKNRHQLSLCQTNRLQGLRFLLLLNPGTIHPPHNISPLYIYLISGMMISTIHTNRPIQSRRRISQA